MVLWRRPALELHASSAVEAVGAEVNGHSARCTAGRGPGAGHQQKGNGGGRHAGRPAGQREERRTATQAQVQLLPLEVAGRHNTPFGGRHTGTPGLATWPRAPGRAGARRLPHFIILFLACSQASCVHVHARAHAMRRNAGQPCAPRGSCRNRIDNRWAGGRACGQPPRAPLRPMQADRRPITHLKAVLLVFDIAEAVRIAGCRAKRGRTQGVPAHLLSPEQVCAARRREPVRQGVRSGATGVCRACSHTPLI